MNTIVPVRQQPVARLGGQSVEQRSGSPTGPGPGTGYPWIDGDWLYAADLNAGFIPTVGGTATGQVFVNVTNPNMLGGVVNPPGGITPALGLNVTTTPNGTQLFSWAISSLFTSGSISPPGLGAGLRQEGGIASQVIKLGGSNANTWQFFGNTKEISGRGFPNGTGSNVSGEFNLLCNGPENPVSASNPNFGQRAYFTLTSRTYKPTNWAPNTAYALNVSTQPQSGPVWTATTAHGVGDVVQPSVHGLFAYRCSVAGTTGSSEPVWSARIGVPTTDGTVTWTTIHNVGNGFTYFCTVPGTSGASAPAWPLTDGGTVVDGTVTWQYGATLTTQISRAISIGDSDDGDVSYGAALLVTSPCYNAILEFSGASLDTVFNPNAAAIRLAADMPIDFTGNLTPAGQNNHTLRYTHGTSGFPYPSDEAGFGRLSYQIDFTGVTWMPSTAHVLTDTVRPTAANGCLYVCTVAGTSGTTEPAWPTTVGATVADGSLTWNTVPSNQEVFQVEDIGVTTIGSDYATTAVLAVNSAAGAQRQLRFLTNGSQRWGILTGSTPEPGLNVGSDFLISRYSDGGINQGPALTITRATGVVTLATAPVITALPINAANDAAAAAAGVQLGGEYRNGSIKMIRVA